MTKFPEITIILGSGRSGTSYLQQILSESLDIAFFREPKFVIPIYRKLWRFGNLEKESNLLRLVNRVHKEHVFARLEELESVRTTPEDIMDRLIEPTYSGVLYAIFQLIADKIGKTRLGYKFPSDVLHITELAHLFPTANFVHSIRDGRDVALSLLKQDWGPTNLYAGCRYWAKRTAIGRRDGATLGERYFEFRFEDLLFDTDIVAMRLCSFINRDKNLVQAQKLIDQINISKNTDIAFAWKQKLTPKQRLLCESAAGEMLEACGYPIEYGNKAKISTITALNFIVKDYVLRGKSKILRYTKG